MCQLSCSDLTQKVRVDIVYFSFINILMRSPGSGQLGAVEMLVAQHPPHRSLRAELPHKAPASG